MSTSDKHHKKRRRLHDRLGELELRSSGVKQTPARRKMSCVDAGTGLQRDRDASKADAGSSIDEIALDDFFNHFLPPLRETHDVASIMWMLEDNGVIVRDSWAAFNKVPAKMVGVKEDHIFAAVEDIVKAIVLSCIARFGTETCNVFLCNPNRTPEADTRTSTCRPDAYVLVCICSRSGVRWEYIAIPAEFKKKDESVSVNNNNEQIIWDMQQTFRNHPLRRAIRGFSIVGTNMRIWYGTRSELLISEKFNFIEDLERVVHFFMSVMFASEELLGWDTTMTRVPDVDPKINNYDIVVHDEDGTAHVYRTLYPISLVKADALRGRGSRVWACKEIGSDGKPTGSEIFVIKDGWRDTIRPREGTRYKEIEEDVASRDLETSSHNAARLARYLIPRRHHGDVIVRGEPDCTGNIAVGVRGQYILEQPKTTDSAQTLKAYNSQKSIGSHFVAAMPKELAPPPIRYLGKTHYRIVLSKVGIPLHDVHSLRTVFGALYDVVEGIWIMHRHGWVHRDLSTTNILLVDGKPKIVDLEYARKCSDTTSHVIRTATDYFMAVEAEDNNYLHEYVPPMPQPIVGRKRKTRDEDGESQDGSYGTLSSDDDSDDSNDSDDDDAAETTASRADSTSPQVKPVQAEVVFTFNPLHDLESLWWIASFFFVCRIVPPEDRDEPGPDFVARFQLQQAYCTQLFHQIVNRRMVLQHPSVFAKAITNFLPASLAKAGELLVDILKAIVHFYYTVETGTPPEEIDFFKSTLNSDIHETIQSKFKELYTLFKKKDVLVARLDDPRFSVTEP